MNSIPAVLIVIYYTLTCMRVQGNSSFSYAHLALFDGYLFSSTQP